MKPPYTITPKILQLVSSISEKVGAINSVHLNRLPTALRKRNRIKTIQSSLEIEGNTRTAEQITDLLNNKQVLAPQKDILEVQNAIKVYASLGGFDVYSVNSLCGAYGLLMKGLVNNPGKIRTTNVGILKGDELAHLSPSGGMVLSLMNNLFEYLKHDEDILLIKSCVLL